MRAAGIIVAVAVLAAPSVATAQRAPALRAHGHHGALHHARPAPRTSAQTLADANGRARQRPDAGGFSGARQVFTYAPGAIYELNANPKFVTAILLEPGETLNQAAAGDTARWMVTETEGEGEVDGRTIVLVKPQAANLRTNIVLVTSRRTYVIEAVAQSGPAWAAEIAWRYPERSSPNAQSGNLNYGYRIRTTHGRTPAWAPVRVIDDGRRTWIEVSPQAAARDLPPLFVITGEGAELVNYQVEGDRYRVDRLFDVAELRLGVRAPVVVRIERRTPDARDRRPAGRR